MSEPGMSEPEDALEAELRAFTPAGPRPDLRERVLGSDAPEGGESLEDELSGFRPVAPPAALRERILTAAAALETPAESRRAIALQLALLCLIAALTWAANLALGERTSEALRDRSSSSEDASERGARDPLRRPPPADTGLRQRAQQHLDL